MKRALFMVTFLGLLGVAPPIAFAGGHSGAPPPHATPASSASAAKAAAPSAPDPSKYEFVVEKDTPSPGMDAMHIKGAAEGEGYIVYQHVPDAQIVVIDSVKGIPGQPGAGEALKREVLRRYPPKVVLSQLVATNRKELLDAWGKDFPRHPDLDALKQLVPAMRFKGFDYEISVKGGLIYLKMTPGSGKVTVTNPGQLDAVLLAESPSKKDPKPASVPKGKH